MQPMTQDDVKTAADILACLERIALGRQTVAVRCRGESIAELLDDAAVSRITAAIDAELDQAAASLRARLEAMGVTA